MFIVYIRVHSLCYTLVIFDKCVMSVCPITAPYKILPVSSTPPLPFIPTAHLFTLWSFAYFSLSCNGTIWCANFKDCLNTSFLLNFITFWIFFFCMGLEGKQTPCLVLHAGIRGQLERTGSLSTMWIWGIRLQWQVPLPVELSCQSPFLILIVW